MTQRLALCLSVILLSSCASPGSRIDTLAKEAGMSRIVTEGAGYRHVVYAKGAPKAKRLFIFLDGDGRPWTAGGRMPSSDPTTRNPIALKLLANTPAPGAYISRPCYQRLTDEYCSADSWTMGRYSDRVVDSLVTAIRNLAARSDASALVIIGYSGGGALAVLAAERLDGVAAVVTIAANLDIKAWSEHHRYLPLTNSLNPADSEHSHPWREIHLVGVRDQIVPATTTTRYFVRYPHATQWKYAEYEHVCCWVEQWPSLLARIEQEIGQN